MNSANTSVAFRKRGISKRTGLIVRKIGMKTEVDFWGRGQPVTVLQVQDNHVSSPCTLGCSVMLLTRLYAGRSNQN